MSRNTFFCIDAHTGGNPVRVIAGGAPVLIGNTMSEQRQDFLERFDWIRRALMFEPRGHDIMSGTVLYPPTDTDCDVGIIFVETSGCLPMCGHGTIGTVTAILEQGQVTPKREGEIWLDVPAGKVRVEYQKEGDYVEAVRIFNVASYLAAPELTIDCPDLGELTVDVSYGGNYYAIIDPQRNFPGLEEFSAKEVLHFSPQVRKLVNEAVELVHPEDPTIRGTSHVMWTGKPTKPNSDGRNAVFYGDHAIDRSPCGTGTSARMAQMVARGKLSNGDQFIHESIIGSQFTGRVESKTSVGQHAAIKPSIEGSARVTGLNSIFVDDRDEWAHGFQVV